MSIITDFMSGCALLSQSLILTLLVSARTKSCNKHGQDYSISLNLSLPFARPQKSQTFGQERKCWCTSSPSSQSFSPSSIVLRRCPMRHSGPSECVKSGFQRALSLKSPTKRRKNICWGHLLLFLANSPFGIPL